MLFTSSTRLQTSFSLFLGLILLWASASAGAEETRWYDVEVIIFSQNSQQYRNSELWPVDYDLPQMEASQKLLPPQRGKGAPVAFSRLATQDLRLNAQARRISAAKDMKLLLHTGWRQPGLAENKAVAIRVEGESSHQLEGTLKLVLSRYLHIYTDLIYREPRSGNPALQATSTGQSETNLFNQNRDSSSQPQYQAYRLQQSRRMRSRELHYLDHPLFGMAILVTPYER